MNSSSKRQQRAAQLWLAIVFGAIAVSIAAQGASKDAGSDASGDVSREASSETSRGGGGEAQKSRLPASFMSEKFSINFHDTPLKEVLDLIASKAGLALKLTGDPKDSPISFSASNSTIEDALNQIASRTGIEYQVRNNVLYISQDDGNGDGTSAKDDPIGAASGTSGGGGSADFNFRSIPILYGNARELVTSLTKIGRKGESVAADDANNALITYGSIKTFNKIKQFVELNDRRPMQILIEAQIVETTKSFARDLGISWGDLQSDPATPTKLSGSLVLPGPVPASTNLRGIIGSISGNVLEARLSAAESAGDAKVVSRPKVFSLNNHKATIHSGITYHIKTLSAVPGTSGSSSGGSGSTPGGTTGGNVTGGLMEISAGLQLEVTPTIIAEKLVRLVIKVQNSEPNVAAAVDGIPGIIDNTAETSILVRGGETATMAGLVKSDLSKSENRVPWLARVPIIGWLFSSHSDHESTSELMIFITPHIIAVGEPMPTASASAADPLKPKVRP